LSHAHINDTTATSLADALVDNSNIKELLLDGNNAITINGWSAFSSVLCNTSSIVSTFRSNHTLQKLCGEMYEDHECLVPEDVASLLRLNRKNSKSQAARLKIIKSHFREGFTVQPFVDTDWNMDRAVLPHAIAWMSRSAESGGVDDHFFGFLRSTASWFNRHDAQKGEDADGSSSSASS